MKAKIILKHKDSEKDEILVLYNEIFNKNNGVAFFKIEHEKWELINFKPFVFSKNNVDYYEDDKVLVRGTKRIGEYETKIIKVFQGHTLENNKTYFNNDTCFTGIISKL